jgi:hypothetical protein
MLCPTGSLQPCTTGRATECGTATAERAEMPTQSTSRPLSQPYGDIGACCTLRPMTSWAVCVMSRRTVVDLSAKGILRGRTLMYHLEQQYTTVLVIVAGPNCGLLARPSVRAPTATAMSVSSRVLPATRAATSTSRLSARTAATTTRTSQ